MPCAVLLCGMVCGVVWCGVVWRGVVWCGVVWCGVKWCDVVFWSREQVFISTPCNDCAAKNRGLIRFTVNKPSLVVVLTNGNAGSNSPDSTCIFVLQLFETGRRCFTSPSSYSLSSYLISFRPALPYLTLPFLVPFF